MLPTPHPVVVNAYTITNYFIICISLTSNLLSLQTFLASKRIRITNLGVYLIVFSIFCLLVNAWMSIKVLRLYFKIFIVIFCNTTSFIFGELLYSLHWLNSFIAAERCLIQCYDASLYNSRIRRSILCISALIAVQIIVNSLPNIFCRQSDRVMLNACGSDLTSTGKKLVLAIACINTIIPLLLFMICGFEGYSDFTPSPKFEGTTWFGCNYLQSL